MPTLAFKSTVYAVAACFVMATPAHAYIDPGTGSMLLQGLAAGLLGVGVFWRRIVAFCKDIFQKR
ncbi:hypothetical protein FVW27_15680 [Desulfovibrio sp. XJ01]|nr:hypothetical protein [Nitratidesulfovibrio liaohensis]